MSDRVYCYPPDFTVLKNKFDLRDTGALAVAERAAVVARMIEKIPGGGFDLPHLQAIHRHLFQDVYEWAGDVRQVEIAKGQQQFQPRQFIETGMGDIHWRLLSSDFLRGIKPGDFARKAGKIIGDLNYVHPFREGNGRTQLVYLDQLARHAGHPLDLFRLERESWIAASIESHRGRYEPMAACITRAMVTGRAPASETSPEERFKAFRDGRHHKQ